MIPYARSMSMLIGVLAIAGCAQMPDFRDGARTQATPPRTVQPAPGAPVTDAGAVPASAAEAACMEQGRGQGLAVQGVVGTREVSGADGLARSRDVMLRVARGQQVYEVRCSYSYVSNEARIMSL